jgi:hypothetical protein
VFADEELQRLREFPEISREELFRYFTLTPADMAFVAPQGRGPVVRLGLAVTHPSVGVRAGQCVGGAAGRGGPTG